MTTTQSDKSHFFEDLEPGDVFVTSARTVTESDVVGFAGLSGDFNPIHVDAVGAAGDSFGQRVAHGILGIAMMTGLLDRLGVFAASMSAMLSIDEWNFRAPIFIGDTIHLEMTIESTRLTSRGDRGVVRRRMTLVNQDRVTVQEGCVTVLVRTRAAA